MASSTEPSSRLTLSLLMRITSYPQLGKDLVAPRIVRLAASMRWAVDFNNEVGSRAAKVSDKARNDVLTSKLESAELTPTHCIPDSCFLRSGTSSQASRQLKLFLRRTSGLRAARTCALSSSHAHSSDRTRPVLRAFCSRPRIRGAGRGGGKASLILIPPAQRRKWRSPISTLPLDFHPLASPHPAGGH